jgi:hypothetical protein
LLNLIAFSLLNIVLFFDGDCKKSDV